MWHEAHLKKERHIRKEFSEVRDSGSSFGWSLWSWRRFYFVLTEVSPLKNILAPDTPPQAWGRVTTGNTCGMSRVWGRLHGNVIGYQRLQWGSSLLQFPPQGPGGYRQPCSHQVWSITAALLCDWPWQSFVVAPPESCGAAGRRRRTESAATPPAY